jgi:hypothetical protein
MRIGDYSITSLIEPASPFRLRLGKLDKAYRPLRA